MPVLASRALPTFYLGQHGSAWAGGHSIPVGDTAGVAVEAAGSACAGLRPTVIPGDRTITQIFLRRYKMPNGFGRGFGMRGGMGFGFRGSSPPWPYVGRGRGGLPRCGYFLSGAGAPAAWPYQQPPYPSYAGAPSASGYAPFTPQMTKEQELGFLQEQAEGIKGQLDQIEARIRDLESEN